MIPRASIDGALAAGIPGMPAALAHIAERYGRLPLSVSVQLAIRIEREGTAADEHPQRVVYVLLLDAEKLQPVLIDRDPTALRRRPRRLLRLLLPYGIVAALLAAQPNFGSILAIGLAISIFQAVTQIQEMTLSFIPKLIGMAIALIVTGTWMLQLIMNFTIRLFENIPSMVVG